MNIIPLKAIPSQTVSVVLDGQSCRVNVYQKETGLYFDLFKDGNAVITCRICRDKARLVGHKYLNFNGDLFFFDERGVTEPEYSGLGIRYFLAFLAKAELEL